MLVEELMPELIDMTLFGFELNTGLLLLSGGGKLTTDDDRDKVWGDNC
jgi:hypothetical protein